MSGFAAVYRREMLSMWVTPLAWVLWVAFLLLQGGTYYSIVAHFASLSQLSLDTGPVQAYFGQSVFLPLLLLLICPALTMKSFAEERRSGTIESLLTAPVTPAAVVLGKFIATLTTYVVFWVPTVLYIVILRDTGNIDWPVVGSSYLGIFMVGSSYLAVGTLMSAMTRSQLIALMLTIFVLFGLFILGIGQYIFEPGLLHSICSHVSVQTQLEELSQGVVDLRRLVFNGSIVALALFMAVRIVDAWRWG